jgi:hypothetical protein
MSFADSCTAGEDLAAQALVSEVSFTSFPLDQGFLSSLPLKALFSAQ